MFTGIITEVGQVVSAVHSAAGACFEIAGGGVGGAIAPGASVSCSGVCLTATSWDGVRFAAHVSPETLARTTAAAWRVGTRLNLERALRVGDELGGHWVLGHVDGVAELVARAPLGDSLRLQFRAPMALRRFIAVKGSVTLEGVSLTVNEVEEDCFAVAIVPHTAACTTVSELAPGAWVNLEVDALARYAARLLQREDA